MSKNILAILTDAAPSANSSTSREIIDLLDECKKRGTATLILCPRTNALDIYSAATYGIYCTPIFYKNKNLFLRFLSENIIGLSLALKYLFFWHSKNKISSVLWISPSIFNIWAALVIKIVGSTKIYLMLRDLFPFWLLNIGLLSQEKIVFKFLRLVADLQMKMADKIGLESYTSHEMFIKIYPSCVKKSEILSNWMTSRAQNKVKISDREPIIKLLYAGSLGHAQGIEFLVALVKALINSANTEIHVIGRGDGFQVLEDLKNTLDISNLFIHDPISNNHIDDFICQFDIGLLFLRQDLNFSNIPGKALGYLLNGLPILGSINPQNELHIFVSQEKLGWLSVAASTDEFINEALEMISDYRSGKYLSDEIRSRSIHLFSTSKAYNQIINFSRG